LNRNKLVALLTPAVIVLALDQITKYIIRTSPELHNKIIIEGWLRFYYTQNPGMAMGIDWLPTIVVSSVAILAVTGILIYLLRSIETASIGYLIFMGLILGGAFGNISDRIFMGYVEGNGGILEGHVVDFIYFSLQINDWTVFPYIFNVADIGISVSIISLLVFSKKLLPASQKEEPTAEVEVAGEETAVEEITKK
jgi:signal peptidase II|tara:strand:+ start:13674 stop:14261 length:588 start_codon:yes stop_codon:yes gene_type:complete